MLWPDSNTIELKVYLIPRSYYSSSGEPDLQHRSHSAQIYSSLAGIEVLRASQVRVVSPDVWRLNVDASLPPS